MAKVSTKFHHFGGAEARHLNASMVAAVEMKAVEGSQQPQIDTRDPHQHCVLETLGEVWVGGVPCTVPVLHKRKEKIDPNKPKTEITGEQTHLGEGTSESQGVLAGKGCYIFTVLSCFPDLIAAIINPRPH